MDAAEMRARYGEALADLAADGRVVGHVSLDMPAQVRPWTDTGLDVVRGADVTMLATGHCTTMPGFGRGGSAQFYLWRRISPNGRIAKGTRSTTSFSSEEAGRLELAILHGEWADTRGTLATPPDLYALADGQLSVTVIVWGDGVRASHGLSLLRDRVGDDDALIEAELERLAHPVHRPDGWSYLWLLGESDTFRAENLDGHDVISCCTRADAAILKRKCAIKTTPDATLTWRWKIDQLPSRTREDELAQHDYLSVAVEWESGKDITYMWSSSLPVGTVFTCPIPQWAPRETHVVVRSGEDSVGFWCQEQRNLYRDYVDILGAEPGRVVAVWLIAVSIFQHGEGRAAFGPISIEAGGWMQDFV
jgi:hypothetical protein